MVNEGDGSVQVCAELMSGQLGETDFVRLRISTNRIGSSDSGKYSMLYLYICDLLNVNENTWY